MTLFSHNMSNWPRICMYWQSNQEVLVLVPLIRLTGAIGIFECLLYASTVLSTRKTKTIKNTTESAFRSLLSKWGIDIQTDCPFSSDGDYSASQGLVLREQTAGKVCRLHSPARKSFRMTVYSFNYIYSTNMYWGPIVGWTLGLLSGQERVPALTKLTFFMKDQDRKQITQKSNLWQN